MRKLEKIGLAKMALSLQLVFTVKTEEPEFFTEYPSIIDSMRAKWPGVPIYCARIWRRDYPANCATINKYIDTIISSYGSGVYPGPDESNWMENGDNGTTYMGTDGIHYNNAAQPVCAAQWLKAMGY